MSPQSSDADDISSRSSQEINVQNYPDEQPSPTSDHKEPPGETRNREDPHESLQTEKDAQIVMNGAPTFKSKTSKLYNGTEHGRRKGALRKKNPSHREVEFTTSESETDGTP
ncbi:hypothetical protein GDO81_012871 [Engystomops pustulosus]|uniref:Uncharacterized protein n=1 Tax=Engystomops pustulosus TaxID=76066 RepID=A0AAV7AXK7_ENGPU|nr:hypothetical protein GDO81_012871 [Engystomops pustulosus]